VIGVTSMLALIALASRQEIIGSMALLGLSALIYMVQAPSAFARQ
jgi:hypothetical protein